MWFGPPLLTLAALRGRAAAWAMVLTVLFCALLPAGLPLTAPQGSAFNPATTSVALASRGPERQEAVAQRLEPVPDAGQTTPYLLILLPIATLAVLRGAIAKRDRLGAFGLVAQASARAHRARAPPVA